ncbi:MAG: DNA polymerase beta superfamily protein, partial [Phycisphaerales bacterium]
LEQVFSPLVAHSTPAFEELREIARRCVSRRHRFHFFHFGKDQWKIATGSDRPTVKGLLYTYRPLMAGIHLMRSGEVESNLHRLNEVFGFDEIEDLIARKRDGEERMRLEPDELERHRPRVNELCQRLEDAREWSELPEEPAGFAALDDLLLRIRKGRVSLVARLAAGVCA